MKKELKKLFAFSNNYFTFDKSKPTAMFYDPDVKSFADTPKTKQQEEDTVMSCLVTAALLFSFVITLGIYYLLHKVS